MDSEVNKVVVEAITGELRAVMGRYGLRDVEVHAGDDFEGDPVLLVEASYELQDAPVDPKLAGRVLSAVRERLLAIGERRFPHIRHLFHEDQKVA